MPRLVAPLFALFGLVVPLAAPADEIAVHADEAIPERVAEVQAAPADAQPAAPDADNLAAAPLAIVSTWGDLASQPAVTLPRGGTIRMGIESDRIHADGGILVYALLDGDQWDPEAMDALGPLRIRVTPEKPQRLQNQLEQIQMQMQVPDGEWRNARRLLFVTSVSEMGGPARVDVLHGNKVVAQTRLVVDAAVIHPWFAFAEDENGPFPDDPSGESAEVTLSPDLTHTAVPSYEGVEPFAWDTAAKPISDAAPLPRFTLEPEQPTIKLTATRRRSDYRLDIKLPEASTVSDIRGSVLVRWWVDGQPVRPPDAQHEERMFDRGMQIRQTDRVRINLRVPEDAFGQFGGERVELQLLWCPDGWDRPDDPMNRMREVRRLQIRMNQGGPAKPRHPIMSNRIAIVMPFRVGLQWPHERPDAIVVADPRDGVE